VDTIPGLTETNSQKRALVMESQLNRQVLRLECGRIHAQVERIKHGYGWAQHAWKFALPLAGFLLAKKFKRTSRVAAKGSFITSALGTLWKVWQGFRAARSSAAPRR
jgi:hypothetical protein